MVTITSKRRLIQKRMGMSCRILSFLSFLLLHHATSESTRVWPEKISWCSLSGTWPSEFELFSQGNTIRIATFELEKTNNNTLEVLITAVSKHAEELETAKPTSELIRNILPKLNCDFRKGGVKFNARYKSLAKTPIEMTVMAEDGEFLTAKLSCPLPSKVPAELNIKHFATLGMEGIQMLNSGKLHWQLNLPTTISPDGNNWIEAHSKPLCGHGISPKKMNNRPDAALCVIDSSHSPLQDWPSSLIRDWIFYQRNLVGFSDIFVLDRFGEELSFAKSEIATGYDNDYIHVPHSSLNRHMASLMREGPVAETLARERCLMMARQKNVEFVLVVNDAMNLVVLADKENGKKQLSKALKKTIDNPCTTNVRVQQIHLSFDNYVNTGRPDYNNTSGMPSVSQFLTNGKTLGSNVKYSNIAFLKAIQPSSSERISCNDYKNMTIDDDKIQIVIKHRTKQPAYADEKESANESLTSTLRDFASWVERRTEDFTRGMRPKRTPKYDRAWIPSPQNTKIPVRMCRSRRESGPTYGQAIMLQLNDTSLSSESVDNIDVDNSGVALTFYNAELVSNDALAPPSLSVSMYAENFNSFLDGNINESRHAQLEQRTKVFPNVDCIFLHPDRTQREHLTGETLRTRGVWYGTSNVLKRLQCPLPEYIPEPDLEGLSFLIAIEPAYESREEPQMKLHMIRPIQLCVGAETTYDGAVKKTSYRKRPDTLSIACRVGCIDDVKATTDPHARCSTRCDELDDHYERFMERDYWTPKAQIHSTVDPTDNDDGPTLRLRSNNNRISTKVYHASESVSRVSTSSNDPPLDTLSGQDLSICMKPPSFQKRFSTSRGNNESLSPQRLIEWIEYHILIGFDIIYILDRGGESLSPLLTRYIENGRVILFDFPDIVDTDVVRSTSNNNVDLASYDQRITYDYCMSIGRRRNDAYMALIGPDEFVRYPEIRAGEIRTSVSRIIRDEWTPNSLPDSILLEHYDFFVKSAGLALGYTKRRMDTTKNDRGKEFNILVRPQAMIQSSSLLNMERGIRKEGYTDDSKSPVVVTSKLAVFHYDEDDGSNERDRLSTLEREKTIDDFSLQWAYRILASQFVSTEGWRSMRALAEQGFIQLGGVRRREPNATSDLVLNESKVSSNSGDTRPSVFLGILTYCSNRERRDAIRETWLSREIIEEVLPLVDVHVRFILGQAPSHEKHSSCSREAIEDEMRNEGDLLIVDDTNESYQVLTRKTLAMFSWVSKHVNADFVLKTDDDSYINIRTLADSLVQVEDPTMPLYFGHMITFQPWLVADYEAGSGRWYAAPEDMPSDLQTYGIGGGYMLSQPLVRHLAKIYDEQEIALKVPWSPEEKIGWLEDAAIGFMLRGAVDRAGRLPQTIIEVWHAPQFRQCHGDYDLSWFHHVQASQQYNIHNGIQLPRGNTFCNMVQQLGITLPKSTIDRRADDTKWRGSILERRISPLITMSPPPPATFENNPRGGEGGGKDMSTTEMSAPYGRDVIVVTGRNGKIGQYLITKIRDGHARLSGPLTVLVLDNMIDTSSSSIRRSDHSIFYEPVKKSFDVPVTVKLENVDITNNYQSLLNVISRYAQRIRGIVHLDSIQDVQNCQLNSERCQASNIEGTKNILRTLTTIYGSDSNKYYETMYRPWILYGSSSEVYGNVMTGSHELVITEQSPFQPTNLYGETKVEAERTIQRWVHHTGFNAVALRFNNVYGSCREDYTSEPFASLMSDAINNNNNNNNNGNSNGRLKKPTVSLLHIQDAVQGVLLAINYVSIIADGAGIYEAFNIGGHNHPMNNILPIRKLVELNNNENNILDDSNRPDNNNKNHANKQNDDVQLSQHQNVTMIQRTRTTTPTSTTSIDYNDKAFRVLGYKPSSKTIHSIDDIKFQIYLQRCNHLNKHKELEEERNILFPSPNVVKDVLIRYSKRLYFSRRYFLISFSPILILFLFFGRKLKKSFKLLWYFLCEHNGELLYV